MPKSTFLQDFKAFAMRGNVVDMAVGVVIGTAFGKIVSSIVSDLIMPLIGVICGGVNFTDLSITLKKRRWWMDRNRPPCCSTMATSCRPRLISSSSPSPSSFSSASSLSSIARNKRCRLLQNLRSPARKCNCSRKSATC